MANIHVDLPRGHSVELRDPWDVTEGERKPLMARIAAVRKAHRAQPAVAEAPTAPQLGGPEAVVDDGPDPDVTTEIQDQMRAFFVVGWAGDRLADQPISPETFTSIPVPLLNAIDEAISPLWQEVLGINQPTAGSPTTP